MRGALLTLPVYALMAYCLGTREALALTDYLHAEIGDLNLLTTRPLAGLPRGFHGSRKQRRYATDWFLR